MDVFTWIINTPESAAYIILIILLLCGVGLPIPEDIPLITLGYMLHENLIGWPMALSVGFLGVLGGDVMTYWIGYYLGDTIFLHPFIQKMFSPHRINRAKTKFQLHGLKVVFFGRFLTGFRAITFFTAGLMRISFLKFISVDGLAALVSIPALIAIGYFFGEKISLLIHHVKKGREWAFVVVAVIIIAYIFIHWLIKKGPKPAAIKE